MKKLFLNIILLFAVSLVFSQETVLSELSVSKRKLLIDQREPDVEKIYADQFARENGIPIRVEYKNGTIIELRRISKNGVPQYYKTENLNAAKTISTNKLWDGGELGLDLNGAGIVVGVWDAGTIRSTHDEFEARVRLIDDDSNPVFHATHVAGTIAAAGLRSDARGMANKSTIDGYDWSGDNSEMRSAAQMGMLISNHSYGYIQGWEYNNELERWEWYGDESISSTEDYNFGFYGDDARMWDDISYDNPKYLIVKSAGNDRGDGPAPGAEHFIWSGGGWTKSTEIREVDGNGAYDCIGTQGTSKNILTVGAANDISDGYEFPSDVTLASFSTFGPTDDGRIKPDIVGNGITLISTNSSSDNSYASSSGTSMSSPSVAGSLALLQEHFRDMYGKYMNSSLLKGLVLHTADDAGNPGPDYKFGWGLMNSASAADVISMKLGESLISDTLKNALTDELFFYSTGLDDIKITLTWLDPPGKELAAQLNPTDPILVNDLDIRLIRVIDEQEFRPFVLTPTNPSASATRGDNRLDNVEQIIINNPISGYYTLKVSHKFDLQNDLQEYSLVVSGLTKEYVANGLINKEEVNGEILLTSAVTYKNGMDVHWLIEPENGLPITLGFDYFDTEPLNDNLKIYNGPDATYPLLAEFSGVLSNPDSLVVSTAGIMSVIFNSNETISGSGFKGKYCTVAPAGDFSIEGNVYPCENTMMSYFALGQEGSAYLWESEENWTITWKTENGIDLGVESTSSILKVLPYNKCGNGLQIDKTILPLNSPPELTSIHGDTIPCAGVTNEYITTDLEGATYSWQVPVMWLGNSESSSITIIPNNSTSELTVRGENACGRGNELSLIIEAMDKPVADNILTEIVPPCAESIQLFYVDSQAFHNYLWSVDSDWEILSGETNDTVMVKVGNSPNFLQILTVNKCGEKESSRLFLTAEVPDEPIVELSESENGYPFLTISNTDKYESIQWYLNGEEIAGTGGVTNPLNANMNGIYSVASISDKGCYKFLSEEKNILVNEEKLSFASYRISESKIAIENTLSKEVSVNIISAMGRVERILVVQPGYNELDFSNRGIYLLHFFEYGNEQVLKVSL